MGPDQSGPHPATAGRGSLGARVIRSLPPPDSIWWLVAVAVVFTAAQLEFIPLHLAMGSDEVVYVGQVSIHTPPVWFGPARARGITLVVAPVSVLTSSVTALRLYLAVVSGLGLFGALAAWRRLRPAWVLALAGLLFGGLWVVQYYGPRAMPDLWLALSGLAAVGLFLRAAAQLGPTARAAQPAGTVQPARAAQPTGTAQPGRSRWALAGLAACLAFATLTRPGDAVFLALPLLLAALAMWRRWQLAVAVVAGLAAGALEWVIEAYARFGGVTARLHMATGTQGGLGFHLGMWAQLQALDGPTQCRPCTIGWQDRWLSVWWLALPVLVALGLFAARRTGRTRSGLLAVVCGVSVALQYLVLIDYAAPRFLIPAYALLAVPVADGLGWLLTGVRPGLRPVTTALVAVGLALQLVSQHGVLQHEVTATLRFHSSFARIAADLHRLGVRPPCLINGSLHDPIAFAAGCASTPNPWNVGPAVHVAEIVPARVSPPDWARGWHRYRLHGTRLIAYVRGTQ